MRPNHLTLTTPYFTPGLAALGAQLPPAFRALPYAGRVVNKPVLRQAFAGLLPDCVTTRNFEVHLEAITQHYCVQNAGLLRDLLAPDAHLVRLGVVDPMRLKAVLEDRPSLLACGDTILHNVMVELWLRSWYQQRRQ